MKWKEIVKDAEQCIYNVEHKRSASINNVRDFNTLGYLFSSAILRVNKYNKPMATGIKRIKSNPNYQGTAIDGGIGKQNYLKLCQLMVNWCEKNNYTAPSYLRYLDYKIIGWVWTYAVARIVKYYDVHKKLPSKVLVTHKPFVPPEPPKPAPTPKPKSYSEEIFDYFTSKFGSVDCIDDALEKVQGNGYGYYYDDVYSNRTSIDRMADGDGVNCTDSCHVFWHIGIVLGYDVQCIHVMCRGGDGHVRLQFRHDRNTDGEWIDRDPAAVLDGNNVEDIWCSNGEYLSTDPDWFLENLYR